MEPLALLCVLKKVRLKYPFDPILIYTNHNIIIYLTVLELYNNRGIDQLQDRDSEQKEFPSNSYNQG